MGVLYKEEPTGDPSHHPLPVQQGPGPQHLQHSRSTNIAHQQPHPDSPHQNQHASSFPSPHSSNHGLPLHHQPSYSQPVPGTNGHAPPEVYYAPSPYGTPVSGHFSSAEAPDLMAAAHMQQRPYQQPVYHTPQSNSPASVASSQSHDQHGRMYAQAPAQMQQVYGYPQYQVPPSAYPQHPGQQQQQQHHMMASQPLLPHQQAQATMAHQSSAQQTGITNSPRPQTKLEPGIPRQMDPASLQRSPTGPMASNHNAPAGPSQNGNGLHPGQTGGGGGVNPNAAPGPIPATTPLVVRQDNNGVQWIAFEYSRDRVKMEYTIRCDVESVNTDSLPQDFRNENCVYPRACCAKDSYKGNRLQYENECNTVGWALAELNPCLRGKRGLIQRAVDSWRNSNQDPRLRSRRVRRMAKINTRKNANHTNNHLAGPRDVGGQPPSTNPMAAPVQRPPPANISMAGPAQLHHHHAHPDGSTTGSTDDVSVNGDFDPQPPQQQAPESSPALIRPSNVFHGYQAYPQHPTSTASMPPHLSNGLDHSMPNHAISTSTSIPTAATKIEKSSPSPLKKHSVFGDLPEAKRRKFINVFDTERKGRVRVKLNLESVEIAELPDSYRRDNSVYPRSFCPTEMPQSPRDKRIRRIRFVEDNPEDGGECQEEGLGVAEMGRWMQVGSVTVPVPMVEGGQGEGKREGKLRVPGLGRRAKEKEDQLNDMGYRISWSQSRMFAGKLVFLQKSLDAYRNKVGSTMAAGGQEVSTVAPHLETRIGKKMWVERKSKRARGSKRADTP